MNIEHPFILQSKIVAFCWIPSDIGINGNTKADKAAKDALKFDIAQFQIPFTDLKLSIKVQCICKQSLANILGFTSHK